MDRELLPSTNSPLNSNQLFLIFFSSAAYSGITNTTDSTFQTCRSKAVKLFDLTRWDGIDVNSNGLRGNIQP